MNLQQLEYVVAVDTHRHFAKAAAQVHVTQATLSMMIKKLEEELGVLLFDRSKQPVIPTEAGAVLIHQARLILKEVFILREMADASRHTISGELRVGIIPTVAPYLLPVFLKEFVATYPDIHLKISEMNTAHLLEYLERDLLDVGILATPLQLRGLKETPLYQERFMVYVSEKEVTLNKAYIGPEEIEGDRLLLLEEGHCLRSQILKLCELRKQGGDGLRFEYEAGSIESLLKMVDIHMGVTIVPELVAQTFSPARKKQLRQFKSPVPTRQISLVTNRHFVKARILQVLVNNIKKRVHQKIQEQQGPPLILDIE